MKYKNAHSSKTTRANELKIYMLLLQGKSGFLGKFHQIWIIFDNIKILIIITCWPIVPHDLVNPGIYDGD